MGLFDRFRKPKRTVDDPVFGMLEYSERHAQWEGEVMFGPLGSEVAVHVPVSGGEVPGASHRDAFVSLAERYQSLGPAMGAALFALWEPHLEDWDGDNPPVVTTAEKMLSHTELDWIEVRGDGSFYLGFGFTDAVGWDDAMFWLKIQDWKVLPDTMTD